MTAAFDELTKSLATATAGDPLANLTAATFWNPLVMLIVSMVIGAILGYISAQVANALGKKAAVV